MPEEEIENLDDDNKNSNSNRQNKDATRASSKSSLKDTFNKYKSRRNSTDTSNTNKSNTVNNKNNTIRNRALNGIKNQAFNKMANSHPALKALSVLNGAKNMIGRSRNPINSGGIVSNSSSSNEHNAVTNDIDNDADKSTEDTGVVNNTNEEIQTGSGGSLGSLVGGTNGFFGRFSFMGKLSLPMKIGIIVGSVFFGFFLLILVVTIPVGIFSGFFGMDEVIASNGASGNIDYGDYELSSDGDEILHESLESFLSSKGTSLEEFNNLIASNVENSGYGTDAGVVAAAVTLIAELGNNYDVKIPYFWGGGHGQMIDGAAGNWGSNQCRASANGRIYDYCGLDCSGFVAWAIYNGGFNIAARTAGNFQNLPGAERVSLSSSSAVLAPGDLLESNSHVVIVIGVDEDTNEYICAEASGYTTGVLFTRRPFSRSGYWGVKMSGFYERQVRS